MDNQNRYLLDICSIYQGSFLDFNTFVGTEEIPDILEENMSHEEINDLLKESTIDLLSIIISMDKNTSSNCGREEMNIYFID